MADNSKFWGLYKHPKWQEKRLEILKRDEFTCQQCYDSESELHVHHRNYVKGRKPWEYENSDLVTYCKACHDDITDAIKSIKHHIGQLRYSDLLVTLGFVFGLDKQGEKDVFHHKTWPEWEGHCLSSLAHTVWPKNKNNVDGLSLDESHTAYILLESIAVDLRGEK